MTDTNTINKNSDSKVENSGVKKVKTEKQIEERGGFFRNLKIGTKLMVGFGLLVLMTFLSAGTSYIGSFRATAKINLTDDVRVPTALVAARAQAVLLRMQGDVRGYLALGDQEYQDRYEISSSEFRDVLSSLTRLSPYLGAQNNQRLSELKIAYEQWATLPDNLFELRNDQIEREPAYRLLATDGTRLAGTVLIDIGSLIQSQAQRDATPENIRLIGDMAKFQGTFASMFSGLRGYVTTRNRIYRQEYEVNMTANQFAWNTLFAQKEVLSQTQQTIIENVAGNREKFLKEIPEKMFDLLEGERWREDLYIFRTQALPLAEKMRNLLTELTDDQQALLRSDLAKGRSDLIIANHLTLAGGVIALLVGLLLASVSRRNIAGPVIRLTRVAEQIRSGDLEAQAKKESGDEIGILAETFNNMTKKLRDTLTQVRKEKKRADDLLEVVIPIGIDLASEKDFNRLLEKMLLEAKKFCNADAGILYLQRKRLEFVIVRNDKLEIFQGGTTGNAVTFPSLAMHHENTGAPNYQTVATYAALTGESINIPDIRQEKRFTFSGIAFENQEAYYKKDIDPFTRFPCSGIEVYADESTYDDISYLTIPLKNPKGEVSGVLQLINAQDPETGERIPFDQNLQQMMESFSSLAVAALEAYIREQTLKEQIQKLRIEIDEAKRQKQVREITESDSFLNIQSKAEEMRRRRREMEEKSKSGK